jgi:hypothetical protein
MLGRIALGLLIVAGLRGADASSEAAARKTMDQFMEDVQRSGRRRLGEDSELSTRPLRE